jgi:hypothetical protein
MGRDALHAVPWARCTNPHQRAPAGEAKPRHRPQGAPSHADHSRHQPQHHRSLQAGGTGGIWGSSLPGLRGIALLHLCGAWLPRGAPPPGRNAGPSPPKRSPASQPPPRLPHPCTCCPRCSRSHAGPGCRNEAGAHLCSLPVPARLPHAARVSWGRVVRAPPQRAAAVRRERCALMPARLPALCMGTAAASAGLWGRLVRGKHERRVHAGCPPLRAVVNTPPPPPHTHTHTCATWTAGCSRWRTWPWARCTSLSGCWSR